MELGKMSRTWWRKNSDGTFFRSCGAVKMDRSRPVNWLPWRQIALNAEWWEIFRAGVISRDAIPEGDRWVAYDDSPEATREWARNFLASRGR